MATRSEREPFRAEPEEMPYPEVQPTKPPPEIRIQPGSIRIPMPSDSEAPPSPSTLHPVRGLKKSISMTSIRQKFRENRERFRRNQCCGIVCLLILGTGFNVLAYFASVWSAQLQAEVVKTAVENEHTLRFKIRKTMAEAPSKYLIGLLNFGGRVLSALGIVMLVQVVASYLKRRRYNVLMRSAAEEADTVLGDFHGGITESCGDCCLACVQAFN